MKTALKTALPALLMLLLLLAGCSDDESEPEFTRLVINPQCGVVPLEIEGYATVTGGNESGDPTGGNSNLEMTWDFDDGTSGQTSLAYHVYDEPGTYEVKVTAEDPDGKTATIMLPVTVRADTLSVQAESNFHGELINPGDEGLVTTGESIFFGLWASACDIDPDEDDHYRSLSYVWKMNDGTGTRFYTRNPVYSFSTAGTYEVSVAVTLPSLAVTRHSTLEFTVVDP
jgi:PKD repeat protein